MARRTSIGRSGAFAMTAASGALASILLASLENTCDARSSSSRNHTAHQATNRFDEICRAPALSISRRARAELAHASHPLTTKQFATMSTEGSTIWPPP